MKRIFAISFTVLLAAACGKAVIPAPVKAPYAVMTEGYIGSIKPEGWILEYLQRQKSGLSGHPDVMCYPYNTCLWNGTIPRERGGHGCDWWRYEQTGYYSDGVLRLGYLLGDDSLSSPVEEGIAYSLALTDTLGVFGGRWEMDDPPFHYWPQAVFFRAVQAYCEKTGDKSVLPVLEKHFLAMPDTLVVKERNAINIEGMLWTYGQTGNPELLSKAERTWENATFWLRQPERMTESRLAQHGVTACEQLKIPVILYEYTGNREYLDYAVGIHRKMVEQNMLPDGVISSAEHFVGRVANRSHETCDITDYGWTLGYFLMATGDASWGDAMERACFNAGPGACSKDFKGIQYLSSVNQFISTGHSNNNEFMHGKAWMQYRPVHQVECCVGNVHRMMPNYTSRMWMSAGESSVVAALFGPSEFSAVLKNGRELKIREKTEYPFGDSIDFDFHLKGSAYLDFRFRIPRWAEGVEVSLNGEAVEYGVSEGGFASIRRKFREGDNVHVQFFAPVRVVEFAGQGCYVERGPLLYAYPIPDNVSVDNEKYEYIHKNVDNPDFKSFNHIPAGKWNYALASVSPADMSYEKTEQAAGTYPFDCAASRIKVPVREIQGWTLDEDVYTPENPSVAIPAEGAPVEYLELVPYGCTCLRLTVFPVVER